MLFNSIEFLVFLPVVVWVFYQLTPEARQVWLLLVSYVFYWCWSIPWSLLLVLSTILNYGSARGISASADHPRRKAVILAAAVALNLAVLALFKYEPFIAEVGTSLIGNRPWPQLDLILPMGISFYTFQLIGYVVDVYRGHVAAERSILRVALFVSFFPQLVAGPIERAGHLMEQLSATQAFSWDNVRWGLSRVVAGLVKKVFIADSMALIVGEAYGNPTEVSGFRLLVATYAFAVQIYCDFSAYSDIAIGSARMLGIRLMENFNAPYLALSIRDFWRRWHISLSAWLRDYLFIPLGGSRRGGTRTYVNLMLTMLLGGLWHGAGWNWVVWGGLQGAFLSGEKFLEVEDPACNKWRALQFARWLITFHLVCLSWVFFRAADLAQAGEILSRIVMLVPGRVPLEVLPVFLFGMALLVSELLRLRERWTAWCLRNPRFLPELTVAFAILLLLTFNGVKKSEFIYFQF